MTAAILTFTATVFAASVAWCRLGIHVGRARQRREDAAEAVAWQQRYVEAWNRREVEWMKRPAVRWTRYEANSN